MTDQHQPSLPDSLRGPSLPIGIIRHFSILVALLGLALVVFCTWALSAFDDQGYAPEQPIAYSHKLHAGDMHIPCLYCHFNAERGKHAGVPPMSVCLGCHGQGQGGVKANQPEIQKLQAIADKGSYTDADGVLHEGGVVHWNRVHKLPDHVYFSHQWHVKAGVACQTCHGPIETMTVVRQYAPLSMGWCLDCHRNTNYVGGPGYHRGDPSTFTVGTANYEVVQARDNADPLVVFTDRQLKGQDGPTTPTTPTAPAASDAAVPGEQPDPTAAPSTWLEDNKVAAKVIESMRMHYKSLKDRPNWRLLDLPESHRAAYKALFDQDPNHQTFMNAPTQCSTCHQ